MYSDYRQFIVFKAKRMAKIFGTTRERPPRYSELYYKELAPARNNRRNVDKLMKKTQEQQEESQKKLDILNDDSYQQQQQLLLQVRHWTGSYNKWKPISLLLCLTYSLIYWFLSNSQGTSLTMMHYDGVFRIMMHHGFKLSHVLSNFLSRDHNAWMF